MTAKFTDSLLLSRRLPAFLSRGKPVIVRQLTSQTEDFRAGTLTDAKSDRRIEYVLVDEEASSDNMMTRKYDSIDASFRFLSPPMDICFDYTRLPKIPPERTWLLLPCHNKLQYSIIDWVTSNDRLVYLAVCKIHGKSN